MKGNLTVIGFIGLILFTLWFGWLVFSSSKKQEPASVQSEPEISTQPKEEPQLISLLPNDKIRDWKAADYTHRISLCIGFATVFNKRMQTNFSAQDFHNCIEEATRGLSQVDDLTIGDVAVGCLNEMMK